MTYSPLKRGEILTHQEGATFQENSVFDRIPLKKNLLLEFAYKLETPAIIVVFLLTRALIVDVHLSPHYIKFSSTGTWSTFLNTVFHTFIFM
jgi:hypothetical protein